MRILHWLEISNFKGYRSSGRIPLEHPSVLIGPNNCGKTTALQAIALWSTAVRSWQQNAKDSKAKTRTGKPLNRLAIQAVPVPKTRQFWKNLKVSGHELQISLGLELEGAVVPVTMVFRHHASDVPVMPWCWSTCRSPQQRDVHHRLASGFWSIVTTPTSVLFLAHGSPLFALEPGAAGSALAELATGLERPRALLVISPHWETEVPTVGTASQLPTIHDFGGFDPALYDLHYPASGSPQGAQEVVAALSAAGLPVSTDAERGLDHGAWVPLRVLFPAAEVPVVPLSIQHHRGPEHAYHVGQALAPLAEQGWLIVASGNITHNLPDWQQARLGGGGSRA